MRVENPQRDADELVLLNIVIGLQHVQEEFEDVRPISLAVVELALFAASFCSCWRWSSGTSLMLSPYLPSRRSRTGKALAASFLRCSSTSSRDARSTISKSVAMRLMSSWLILVATADCPFDWIKRAHDIIENHKSMEAPHQISRTCTRETKGDHSRLNFICDNGGASIDLALSVCIKDCSRLLIVMLLSGRVATSTATEINVNDDEDIEGVEGKEVS